MVITSPASVCQPNLAVEYAVPFFVRQQVDRATATHARRMDHAVEPARRRDCRCYCLLDGRGVEHIGPAVLEICQRTLWRFASNIDTDHGGTLGEESIDRGQADTRSGTGH